MAHLLNLRLVGNRVLLSSFPAAQSLSKAAQYEPL